MYDAGDIQGLMMTGKKMWEEVGKLGLDDVASHWINGHGGVHICVQSVQGNLQRGLDMK
jgi:hypothetical protein